MVAGRTWAALSNLMMVMMLPATFLNSHAGYNKHDINFGRFYKAATQTSKRLLREVFLMMLDRSHVSSGKHPMTVADYCFNILSWSKRKYRESFNAEERALLEKPVTSTDFDISLLTKMIHKLFLDMDLPEPFSRAIRDLKNVRNRVCHEHVILDNSQLRENFDDLKMMYKQLLRESAEFFTSDLDYLLNDVQDEVDGIFSSPLSAEASEDLHRMEEFRTYLVGKFITYGRKELMSFYSKLKILNPFTWLNDDHFQEMLVDKIFTPLHITEHSRSIEVSSLLTTECICHETLEATGIIPSVLVLSGIAGCGKTSLCRYFLHDWGTSSGGIATLRSVDILIHIEVRSVTCSSLVSYLKRTLMIETCSFFEEQDVIETLQQMNILYVIDGMDEAMADGRQLVNEVLSVLGNSRAIITTRPEFSSSVVQVARRHNLTSMKLCIKGFSIDGMSKFTSQVFSSLEPDEKQRRQQECEFFMFLKKANSALGDHLKLPLTLVLLISLWREDRSRMLKVTSATRLYFEIFRMCTMKLISRLQTFTLVHDMDLETFTEEWLRALGKEAYNMLENGEYIISDNRRKMLMSLCSAQQIDSIQVLSAFLMCEVKESFRGIQYSFSFIHKSQMEYLAAMYLTRDISLVAHPLSDKIISLLEKLEISKTDSKRNKMLIGIPESAIFRSTDIHKWSNTLCFVIGHLCINRCSELIVREVMKKLLESRSYSYNVSSLWKIVQESDCHPIVCEMVGSLVHKQFVWRPKNEDLCNPIDPVFQLLQHTHLMPKEVLIRILDSTSQALVLAENGHVERRARENLVPILTCLSQRPSVKVDFRMEQHFYSWDSPDTSDDLLTTLLPTGNLTSFMGHLGVSGVAALASVRDISEAYIRVSDVEALQVLRDSLSAAPRNIAKMTLRLNIPSTVAASSLPKFSHTPELSIVLKGVDDDHAVWAGEVLAQLTPKYSEVDLVASCLMPSGGERFLNTLRKGEVRISERLTIRSVHRLPEDHYHQMSKAIQCPFSWWY